MLSNALAQRIIAHLAFFGGGQPTCIYVCVFIHKLYMGTSFSLCVNQLDIFTGNNNICLSLMLDINVRFSFLSIFEGVDVHIGAYVAYFLYESAH